MADNCSQCITLIGDASDVKKVLDFFTSTSDKGEVVIDFNKLIPMPDDLMVESGSPGEAFYSLMFGSGQYTIEEAHNHIKGRTDEAKRIAFELALVYQANILKYGYPTWYEWSYAKWGTKYNPMYCWRKGNEVGFETKWTPAMPVIKKLSEQFPSVVFRVSLCMGLYYIERDIIVLKNGEPSFFSSDDIQTYKLMDWYKNSFPKSTFAQKVMDKSIEYALCD